MAQTQNLLPTPVKFEALDRYLDGFIKEKRELLQSGFKKGFNVFFQGDDSVLEAKCSKSALLNPEAVSTKLQNEIEKVE